MTETDEMPKKRVWTKESRVEKTGEDAMLGHVPEGNLSLDKKALLSWLGPMELSTLHVPSGYSRSLLQLMSYFRSRQELWD